MSVTVADINTASKFYQALYAHDQGINGVFAGINYIAIMREGKTLVNIFERGENNPLAPIFPTLKVDSVANYAETVKALGGDILIPASSCPCTDSPFASCLDRDGNQFMIKQPRTQ